MELLNPDLPVWAANVNDESLESRLDNNWYSPAAFLAEGQIKRAQKSGQFKILTIEELCVEDGIETGVSPDEDGTIGVIEGKNLKPNFVVPLFVKHSCEATALSPGDLLIGKDGEPGTVAPVTQSLLDFCKEISVGCHVYHLKVKEKYRLISPFVSAFMNSRAGQALIRKTIAGGTTPTIRSEELKAVPILIPSNEECPRDIEEAVNLTQQAALSAMDNLAASELTIQITKMGEVPVRLPTNWAGGGAERSSRILS